MMTTLQQLKEPADFVAMCPYEFDLSGAAINVPFWPIQAYPLAFGNAHPSTILVVKKIIVIYTEATPGSTDATYDNIIQVGHEDNSIAVHTYTIPASKAIGDADIIDQADFNAEPRLYNTQESIQIRSGGSASGTGQVRVGLLLSNDYRQWTDYAY